MKKTILILLTLIALPVLLFNYLNEIGSTYKFGIIAANYNNVIAERSKYFAINKNVNKYSWFTPIVLPDSDIKIKVEHLVRANNVDIALIPEITSEDYLLTIIECSSDKIISISLSNSINETPLSSVGSYLYSKPLSQNDNKWHIEKIDNLKRLNTKGDFAAIAIVFAFPSTTPKPFMKIKKNLFNKSHQILKIEYLNINNEKSIIEYSFKLDWYKHMSGWDKILTIT